MMSPYTKQHLIDENLKIWKPAISGACRNVAELALQLASIDPKIPPEIENEINEKLGNSKHNVAILPDLVSHAVIQITALHLFNLADHLDKDFSSPMVVGPSARSIVENCSLLLFINDCSDPTIRSVRTMRAIQNEVKREKQENNPGASELYKRYHKFTTAFTEKHRGTKIEYPGYTELVDQTLPQVGGKHMYGQLSSCTHHSAWMALMHYRLTSKEPKLLIVYSLRNAISAIRSVLRTMLSIIKYKPKEISDIYKPAIEEYSYAFDNLFRAMFDQQSEATVNH